MCEVNAFFGRSIGIVYRKFIVIFPVGFPDLNIMPQQLITSLLGCSFFFLLLLFWGC